MKKTNTPFRPLNEVHSKAKKQPEQVAPGFYDPSKHGGSLEGQGTTARERRRITAG